MKWWYLFLITVLLGIVVLVYLIIRLNFPMNFAGIMGMNNQTGNIQSDGGKASAAKTASKDVLLEELRQRHQLRALTPIEEGKPIQELPKGIYAFSPCGESLSATRGNKASLEIHRRRDGIDYYVGYASDEDIGKYLARQKNFHILTFPRATEKASSLFEIPIDFVSKCEARQLSDGYLFDLFVRDIPELQT